MATRALMQILRNHVYVYVCAAVAAAAAAAGKEGGGLRIKVEYSVAVGSCSLAAFSTFQITCPYARPVLNGT